MGPAPIKIVRGYSKDKRPDLKQFLINLIASGDGGVPLFLSCGNGNDNDKAKFAKKILEDEAKANSLLTSLSRRNYENRTEIKAIFECEQKKLKYHYLVLKDVVKTTDKKTKKTVYKATIVFEKKSEKIEEEEKKAGRFILATNVLEKLSPAEIIIAYKGQQSCERGFRFLKDPLFFADSVFLKYPSRVETMAMLMGLSLLVYTIGQRQLRANLKQNNTGVKNQLGKITDRPTLRWIFQCFQGIHVVVLNGVKQIVNLTDSRLETINYFSKHCQKYYILSG